MLIKHFCAFWFQDGATITELLLPGSLLTTFAASLRAPPTVKRWSDLSCDKLLEVGVLSVLLPMRPQVWQGLVRWTWIQFERSILLVDNGTNLSPLIELWSLRGRSLVVHNALLGAGPLPRAAAEIEGLNHHRSHTQESPWCRRNLRLTIFRYFSKSKCWTFIAVDFQRCWLICCMCKLRHIDQDFSLHTEHSFLLHKFRKCQSCSPSLLHWMFYQ